MKVKVIKKFNEMPARVRRNVGDEIELPKEKAKALIESGHAEEVKIVKEEVE